MATAYPNPRAEDGARTRDLNLGKVALYRLSYFRTDRHCSGWWTPTGNLKLGLPSCRTETTPIPLRSFKAIHDLDSRDGNGKDQ